MVTFDERLRRLEERMARLDVPPLDEVGAAFGRVTERARAKRRGEPASEGEEARDRDTIERWASAEGVDLENEAERAKEKLGNVDRPRE